MQTLTATERGDLAERMLPIACQLACIAHGDGGQHDIAHAIHQLDAAEREALIVALATLVDPEQVLADALGHVTWDEHGRPAEPTRDTRTLRQIARIQWTPTDVSDRRSEALRLHRLGHTAGQIAARVGVADRTVVRWKRVWEAAA